MPVSVCSFGFAKKKIVRSPYRDNVYYTKRHVFGFCLILPLLLTPFVPQKSLGGKSDRIALALAVLILGVFLVSRGIEKFAFRKCYKP
jgi:hypothetical protein